MFFKFETKLIIKFLERLKMNFLRKLIWRINQKNFYLITCPTKDSQKELIDLGIIEKKNNFFAGSIIDIKKIHILKNQKVDNIETKKNFFYVLADLQDKKIMF